MPIIQIQLMEGRTEEKIEQLQKDITETVSNTLGAPLENIRVIVIEVPKTHWAIGGIAASKRKK